MLKLVLKAVKVCKSVTGEKAQAPNNLHFANWMFCNRCQFLRTAAPLFCTKPCQLGSGQAVPRLTHLAKLVLTLLLSILDLPKMLVSYIVNSQSLEDA